MQLVTCPFCHSEIGKMYWEGNKRHIELEMLPLFDDVFDCLFCHSSFKVSLSFEETQSSVIDSEFIKEPRTLPLDVHGRG